MNARAIVLDRLAGRASRFPDLDLSPLDDAGLEPRDAALARAIDHDVARHWLTLAAVCNAKLSQPWDALEPGVKAALLAGAAQMLYMDRVPDHAIVSEAVAWTKRNVRAKAGGLVNAVLRRVGELRSSIVAGHSTPMQRDHLPLDDGRAWQLTEPVFDENPLTQLSQQTSHPVEALARWMTAFGESAMTQLAMHNLVHPPILVTGLGRAAAAEEPHLRPHSDAGFYVYEGPREELGNLLARNENARVQDPATAHAIDGCARLVDRPGFIIDLCAGKGTKTRQLAAAFPEAHIVATDIDATRFEVLRSALSPSTTKSGSSRIEVVDFQKIRRFDSRADLLVIDAPCSNSGVLARRVEARYRLDGPTLSKVAALQKQILADAIPLLAPEGSILYITCSIEREENERQAAWLQKWHRFELVSEQTLMPYGLPGDDGSLYADGGYAALLRRR